MQESDSQRLRIIEDMLTAVLKSQNNIHWVSGFVYGKTKKGDPFILLYPANARLVEKVCRVYPGEFSKLPPFIPTKDIRGKTRDNPNRPDAIELGLYNESPMFQILTYDGKDTPLGKEKRFGKVLRVTDRIPDNGNAAAPSPDDDEDDDEPTPQAQPAAATHVPAVPNRPLSAQEISHYQHEARTADNDFMFITAVNKLYPANTHDGLKVIRGRVCGEVLDKSNAATQLEAMEKYLSRRKELEKEGKSAVTAHNTAVTDAAALYKQLRGRN